MSWKIISLFLMSTNHLIEASCPTIGEHLRANIPAGYPPVLGDVPVASLSQWAVLHQYHASITGC